VEGGSAAGDDHHVGELGGKTEPGGALGDPAGVEPLHEGFGNQLAWPGGRFIESYRGAHDSTFPFPQKGEPAADAASPQLANGLCVRTERLTTFDPSGEMPLWQHLFGPKFEHFR
jgi:hypothetical protein